MLVDITAIAYQVKKLPVVTFYGNGFDLYLMALQPKSTKRLEAALNDTHLHEYLSSELGNNYKKHKYVSQSFMKK